MTKKFQEYASFYLFRHIIRCTHRFHAIVSGLAVRNSKNKGLILVDTGEGTQHRIQQARLSLQNLIAICITHVHGDHCYGLVGLLRAGMNARTKPLIVIAPKEIQQWFEITAQSYRLTFALFNKIY